MAGWNHIARRIRVPLGFGLALLYGWLARPSWSSIGLGVIAIVAGLAIRGYASGYVRKNESLATTGPYAYVRNPLYLGSIVIALGFAGAAQSLWIGVAMLALFLAIYLPVIRGEEAFLRERFPEFAAYVQQVPRLLPRLTPAASDGPPGAFSWHLYMQHREYNASLGAAAMLALLMLRLWWLR
jgi:protein-S-isoprenylcysteine O-methyltransferase Ste14